MPFILRGVNLAGIDSVYCSLEDRKKAWERLAVDLDINQLEKMISVIPLNKVMDSANNMLTGKSYGRIIVDVNA